MNLKIKIKKRRMIQHFFFTEIYLDLAYNVVFENFKTKLNFLNIYDTLDQGKR